MNAEQYLRKWNVDVGVAPNKTIPEGDQRRTAEVLRGRIGKKKYIAFHPKFRGLLAARNIRSSGSKVYVVVFFARYITMLLCLFRIWDCHSAKAIEFNRFEFSPICSHHSPPGNRRRRKQNCIFYGMCVCFFPLLLQTISSVSVHSGSPFECNGVSVMIISAFDEPTADCWIHMLITTIWLYLNMKNWWRGEKTLREADLLFEKWKCSIRRLHHHHNRIHRCRRRVEKEKIEFEVALKH